MRLGRGVLRVGLREDMRGERGFSSVEIVQDFA